MPASRKPPQHYVAKGACPFECCRYGSWTVLAETELVSAPGSRRVVGMASAGTAVTALTGEVHAAPDPVVVLKDGGPSGDTEPGDLPKGSIAFILDTGGEGYGEVYSRGKILNVFIGVSQYCFEITDGCWGETLLPRSKQKDQVWWIKIRLANGIIGWTNKRYNFGNNDACG
jgi:hypothetical protein